MQELQLLPVSAPEIRRVVGERFDVRWSAGAEIWGGRRPTERELRQYVARSVHEVQRERGGFCERTVPEGYSEDWGSNVWRCLPEMLPKAPEVMLDIVRAEMAQLVGGTAEHWRVEVDGGSPVFVGRDPGRPWSMVEVDQRWQFCRGRAMGTGHPLMSLVSAGLAGRQGLGKLVDVEDTGRQMQSVMLPDWGRYLVNAAVTQASDDGVVAGVRIGTGEDFRVPDAHMRKFGLRVGDMVPGMGERICRSEWKFSGRRFPGRVLARMGDRRDWSRGWGDKVSWLLLQLMARVPRSHRGGAGVMMSVPLALLRSMLWGDRWRSRNRDELRELVRAVDGVWIQLGAVRWRPVVCVAWDEDRALARFRICPPECRDHGPVMGRRRLQEAWLLGVRMRRWSVGTVFQALAYEFDRQRSQRAMRVKSAGKRPRGRNPVYATVPEVVRDGGEPVSASGKAIAHGTGRDWSDPRAVATGKRVRNPYLDRVEVLDRRDVARLYGGDGAGEMPESVALRKLVQKGRRAVFDLEAGGFVDVETAGRRGLRVTLAR